MHTMAETPKACSNGGVGWGGSHEPHGVPCGRRYPGHSEQHSHNQVYNKKPAWCRRKGEAFVLRQLIPPFSSSETLDKLPKVSL